MTNLRRTAVLATALLGAAAAGAGAQTTESTARPNVTTPYWNSGGANNGVNVPAGVSTLDEPARLVAQTIQAVPQARADYVVARWTYRRVNGDLNRVSNQMRDDFRNSDEFAAATSELQTAYAEYTAARDDAVKSVRTSDDYRAAEDLRSSLTNQIADVAQSTPKGQKPDLDRLHALASLKIDYITPMRTVERELINASPTVARAKTRLQNAARELARLEKSFSREARDSVELADLRKTREGARIAYLASYVYLEEARYARDVALSYALYSRTAERYTPRLAGYGYGGNYGYGGGFGYGGYGGYGAYRGVVNNGSGFVN